MGHPAPGPSQGVGRADDRRIADFLHEPASRLEVGGRATPGNRLANRAHERCESLAVLTRGDCLELRPEQLHAVPLKNARVGELTAQVQRGLPPIPLRIPWGRSFAITFSRNSMVSGST